MATSRTRLLLVAALLAVACTASPAQPPTPGAAPTAAPVAPAPQSSPASRPAESASAGVSATPLNPPQTVRLSYAQLAAEGPTYIAVEHGYWTELGIQVELVPIAASADTIALLTTGELDVGGILVSPAFYNAVVRGVGVRMVADRGSNFPGQSTFSLAVRADHLQSQPWSGYQQLRGMKIALPQPGSLAEMYLERMLQRGGLQTSDVEIIAPMFFPEMAVAFANRAIDAGLHLEPWATQQEQQGIIKKVAGVDDVAPGVTATVVYSDSFARNTGAARNFMVGWVRGIRHYLDAYAGRRDFQEVLDLTKQYTPIKDEELLRKMPPTGLNPAGYLDPAELASYQDWFAARGLVPQKADIAKVYDPSFADYANSVLGPYQPVENPRRPGG
jgi:NitT/TauT family transport system substrate-binding protein